MERERERERGSEKSEREWVPALLPNQNDAARTHHATLHPSTLTHPPLQSSQCTSPFQWQPNPEPAFNDASGGQSMIACT